MRKTILLAVTCLFLSVQIIAATVSISSEQTIAINFFNATNPGDSIEPLDHNSNGDTACTNSASFTYQNLGESVLQFTNTSTSNQTFTSSWTFYNSSGQFATSTITNPQITFTGQKPYSGRLIIQDSLQTSCIDTTIQTLSLNSSSTCITLQTQPGNATGAEIATDMPNSNFDFTTYHEFDAEQWTVSGTPDEDRGLLKYDLSQIPAGSVILSATLNLYADTVSVQGVSGQPTYGTNNACYLRLINSSWDPATVTWNNQPSTSTYQ